MRNVSNPFIYGNNKPYPDVDSEECYTMDYVERCLLMEEYPEFEAMYRKLLKSGISTKKKNRNIFANTAGIYSRFMRWLDIVEK